MGVRCSITAPHETTEELQPAGYDVDRVAPFGAADGTVGHIANKVHGIPLGLIVPAKLQQVVVGFRQRLEEPWGDGDPVGHEAHLPAEKLVTDAQRQYTPIRPILRKAIAVDAAPMAINSSQAQKAALTNKTATTPR